MSKKNDHELLKFHERTEINENGMEKTTTRSVLWDACVTVWSKCSALWDACVTVWSKRSDLWDACVTTWSKNFTNTTHSETYTSGGKIFAHNALKHVKEILYGGLQLVKVVPDSFKYQISVNFKITVGNAVPHSYDILPRYFRTF